MATSDADVTSLGLGTFVVSCACATLGMMTSLGFLVFHIYHRHNKIVKMTSPNMNLITSFGAILLCAVCFMFGADYLVPQNLTTHTVLCQLRHWLTVHAISLVFAPAALKAWRVHNIFKYGFAKKVIIKDCKLIGMLLGLVLVDAILMTLWQTIDPVTVTTKVTWSTTLDEFQSCVNSTCDYGTKILQECNCIHYGVWLAVLFLWKASVVSVCLYFNWKTKAVPLPSLNDSALTFVAAFLSVIILCCAAMVTGTVKGQRDAEYVITVIAIATCAIIIQLVMFLPKVHYWWTTPNDASPRLSSTSLKTLASAELPKFPVGDLNGNTDVDSLAEIVKENKMLKEHLEEKESMIINLESHLDLAKQKLDHFPLHLDLKHDSGFDPEVSSGSHEGLYDVLRSPDTMPDRSGLYRVEGTPRSGGAVSDDVTDETRQQFFEVRRAQTPNSNASFVEEFTDLRDSIAAEIDNARRLNCGLRDSIALERPYSETEWIWETTDEPEIAGSIAQSFNVTDDRELQSMINSQIPRENFVMKYRRRLSSASLRSLTPSITDNASSSDADNVPFDVPSIGRDSATPNSQQHAAILRYYTYRHDNFKNRFSTYRTKRGFRPPSFKYKPNVPSKPKGLDMQVLHQENSSPPPIYSISSKVRKKLIPPLNDPKDSFV